MGNEKFKSFKEKLPAPNIKTVKKFFRFLAVGLPAFVLAIFSNIFFVEQLGLQKWLAYALVLAMQVTINFFACILFVFDRNKDKSMLSQYFIFVSGVSVVRLFDWMFYVVLTDLLSFYYVLIQGFNVIFFSLIKFKFSRHVIEAKLEEENIELINKNKKEVAGKCK